MKKLLQPLGFIALLGLLHGCAINVYETTEAEPGKPTIRTKLTQYALFQKASVEGVKVSPKTGFSMKGGETETQAEVVEAITRGAVSGAVKGVKP